MAQITSKILFKGLHDKEGVLSDEDIKEILDRSAEILSINETSKIFTNLSGFNDRLKEIGKIIEQNIKLYISTKGTITTKATIKNKKGEITHYNDPFTQFTFLKDQMVNNIEETKMLKEVKIALGEAYFLIMKFREKMTNEKINYGIYADYTDGDCELVNITEENILYFMNINSERIGLSLTKTVVDNIREFINDEENKNIGIDINIIKSKVYNNFIMNGLLASDSELNLFDKKNTAKESGIFIKKAMAYDEKNELYQRYFKYRNNFVKMKDGVEHRLKFNRGHVAEAFDIAYNKLYGEYGRKTAIFNDYTKLKDEFVANLYFDNVKAIKGGDNALDLMNQRSIKAYGNGLYDVSTIYNDIVNLTSILDSVLSKEFNPKNRNMRNDIKNKLINMFFERGKYSSDSKFNQVTKKAVSKVIGEIINSEMT